MKRTQLQLAAQMAMMHHAGQRRRFTDAPYYAHAQDIADTLAIISQGLVSDTTFECLVCAGFLHDTVEDSVLLGSPKSIGYEDLRKRYLQQLRKDFGWTVYQTVVNVTRPHVFNRRSDTLQYIIEDIRKWRVESCCVKLADIYCNLRDYPTDRSSRAYVREKAKQVAAICARLEALEADSQTHALVVAYRLLALALGTFDRFKGNNDAR